MGAKDSGLDRSTKRDLMIVPHAVLHGRLRSNLCLKPVANTLTLSAGECIVTELTS